MTPGRLMGGTVSGAGGFLGWPWTVQHPWQRHTTAGLLRLLGGTEPTELSDGLARIVLAAGAVLTRVVSRLGRRTRRVETIWYGKEQSHSRLDGQGWHSVTMHETWVRLGREGRRPPEPACTRSTSEDSP